MPKYTLMIAADHTQTAHRIEVEAATPWLALENSQTRLGWLSADLFEGRRHVAHAEHVSLQRKGLWRISTPRPAS